jgi:outer membrane protein assembly factor BamB
MNGANSSRALPALGLVGALLLVVIWLAPRSNPELKPRLPGADAAPGGVAGSSNPVLAGKLVPGPAVAPTNFAGSWPQFRGPQRDGIAPAAGNLSRDWTAQPPRELWGLDVGEGYAGVAIHAGRVYLLDYDRDAQRSVLRCLSLADGQEIWNFSYPLSIKRNHGMTRTVPTLAGDYLVALDSKCNVFCLDATTGELRWSVSLVNEFGATVPEWYAGQCPLVEGDKVILAPGGKDALMIALELATGKINWQTPNPNDWKMTHVSVVPVEVGGQRQYIYCASKGVVGVAASDGKLLWETTDWKISIATVPSPVSVGEGKIFLTGGYNAGSLMLELQSSHGGAASDSLAPSAGERDGVRGHIAVPAFKLPANVFGATQHTPILKDGFLYGIRADGRFVCLGLDGKVVWASGLGETFGLGSFLLAEDLIYALNDSGKLSFIAASPERFQLLGSIKPLSGRESWAPMALADGRLIIRDLTRLVCLDVTMRQP